MEVAFGLGYDGAHGAVSSVAPRGDDTRPHGHGTRAAHATSGPSSDVESACVDDTRRRSHGVREAHATLGSADLSLGPSALGDGGCGDHDAVASRGVDTRHHGHGMHASWLVIVGLDLAGTINTVISD